MDLLEVKFWGLQDNNKESQNVIKNNSYYTECVHTFLLLGLLFLSCSVMPHSLQPHGLQHARLSCPSPSTRVCSESRPLGRWCHPTISFSVVPFSSCPQSFPASGSFPESALHIRWPKYWNLSFSISPSNEYSGWWG